MTLIGYHASHEQLAPSALRRAVVRAEEAGFGGAMCSDHLAPWTAAQGHSGHAWTWLGATLQAVQLPMGVVTAPGQRYHPVITAQAIATLAELFPRRFWVALGSGEAVNEHVTGDRWPPKPERERRLLECAAIIRALLAGEEVHHDGLVRVDHARLWSLPPEAPPLLAAAVSEASAARAGAWADGLITVLQPLPQLRRVVDAFRGAGGSGKPVHVQVHLCWDPDEDRAAALALEQWPIAALEPAVLWELDTPAAFEAATAGLSPDDVRAGVLVSSDLGRHTAWLAELLALGVDALQLHHVGQEQDAFIDAFGAHVLPQLTAAAASRC